MTTSTLRTSAVFAVLVAGCFVACSSSDDNNKPTQTITVPASGGAAASIAGSPAMAEGGAIVAASGAPAVVGQGGAVAVAGAPNTVGAGGTIGVAGAPNASVAGAATGVAGAIASAGSAGQPTDCQDSVKSCYRCEAKTSVQLLNHCTDAKCVPFDNKTLAKLSLVPPPPAN